jgi:hypothetical protein
MLKRSLSQRHENALRAINPGWGWKLATLMMAATLFFTCLAPSVQAQIIYGSVVGTVTDSSGAVVQGATIQLRETRTGLTREATTNDAGSYKVSTIPAGNYKIVISKAGFGDTILNDISVVANTDQRADATLKAGATVETVNVSAEAQQLQTDRAEVRAELDHKSLDNLPVAGRNFESLLSTVPGVSPPQDELAMGTVNNPARSLDISSNGTSQNSSNVTIEGVDASNAWIQALSSYIPSQDSIQNVDIVTGSFNAEQGNAGGTAVNVNLKSGTNEFHGSAFEFYTGAALTAWPRFFDPTVTPRKPQLVENQWGGTIGGPVVKNRLFFFFSAERLTDHEIQTRPGYNLPTLAQRQGYFPIADGIIYDPATGNPADGTGRTPFPVVVDPAGLPAGSYSFVDPARWDPATTIFLGALPLPTNSATSNNFTAVGPYAFNSTKYDAKVDFNVTQKFHLNFRLGVLPFVEDVPPAFGDTAGGPPVLWTGQPGVTVGKITTSTLGGIYTFAPNLILDAHVGFTYLRTDQLPPLFGTNYGSDTLKIPNANGPDKINSGVPQFEVGGYFPWYGTWFSQIRNHNPSKSAAVNLTWVKGPHSLRFGGSYNKVDLNIAADLFGYGDFHFNGGATAQGGQAITMQNSFADFLLGQASNVKKALLNENWTTERTPDYGLYAQDQWQVTRKLTVNYGLRWNYFPVPTRDRFGIEVYDPATNLESICGTAPGVPLDCGVKVGKGNFSPLAGIAYRLDEKTVIRAGAGINYQQMQMFRNGLQDYPGNTNFNITAPNQYVPLQTVSTGFGTPGSAVPSLAKADVTIPVFALPAGVAPLTFLPGDYHRGYTESWNLTVERQIANNWSGQIAYVGTHTVHQQGTLNLNVPSAVGSSVLPYAATLGTTPLNVFEPFASSSYNSMQARLSHRFAGGYQVGANYTWSRWIGLCCDTFGDGGPQIPIGSLFGLNRAVMPTDRTHNFNITMVAELPFGKGKRMLNSGIGSIILGGWQTNMVLSAISGTPFTVSANTNSLNTVGLGTQMADKVKPGTVPVHPGNVNSYFDTSYFADPASDCGAATCPLRYGNAGWDSIRGPGIFNVDFGLFKNVPIGERVKLQFKADVFNLTNTPHFSNPGAGPNNPSPANISNGPSAAAITTVNALGGRFGLDQRQIRLGIHLQF